MAAFEPRKILRNLRGDDHVPQMPDVLLVRPEDELADRGVHAVGAHQQVVALAAFRAVRRVFEPHVDAGAVLLDARRDGRVPHVDLRIKRVDRLVGGVFNVAAEQEPRVARKVAEAEPSTFFAVFAQCAVVSNFGRPVVYSVETQLFRSHFADGEEPDEVASATAFGGALHDGHVPPAFVQPLGHSHAGNSEPDDQCTL